MTGVADPESGGLVDGITGSTHLVLILADPVDHLQGFTEFNAAFADAGSSTLLLPAHVERDGFGDLFRGLAGLRNLSGCIVSLPHKEMALELATEAGERARIAGAANLLIRRPDGGFLAEAFDGLGLVSALDEAGIEMAGRRIALAGAGGAARLIALEIARQQPAAITVLNRTEARAQEVCDLVRREDAAIDVTTTTQEGDRFDVLINCTSLGLRDSDAVPYLFSRETAVIDIVNRKQTPLLQSAKDHGCRTIMNGRPMMTHQVARVAKALMEGATFHKETSGGTRHV